MKMKSALTIIGLTLLMASCKKDKPAEDCSVSTSNLSGTYKLTALKYKASAAMPEQDYMLFMDDCEKDDLIKLNSNGTYNYTDAGVECSPSGSGNGTWSVNGNSLQSDGLLTGTISSYNCRDLVYYLENTYTAGDRLTFTMTRQ